MKILHIFSNWKWTGPAEHALNTAVMLKRAGHEVTFACAAPPAEAPESLAAAAIKAGIIPVTAFALNKHFNLTHNFSDIFRLRSFLKKEKFDLIHTHLTNDHLLAGCAARLIKGKTPIVRTCYDGTGIRRTLKNRLLLSAMTDGLITISDSTRRQIMSHYSVPAKRIWKVHVPVDLARFNPQAVENCRAQYRLSHDDIVGGIVARVWLACVSAPTAPAGMDSRRAPASRRDSTTQRADTGSRHRGLARTMPAPAGSSSTTGSTAGRWSRRAGPGSATADPRRRWVSSARRERSAARRTRPATAQCAALT